MILIISPYLWQAARLIHSDFTEFTQHHQIPFTALRFSFDSDGFNKRLDKVYEKFSDNLVRKIRQASNNGKDERAISIINQIFLDD